MTFSKYPASLDDNSSLPKTVDLVTPVKAEVVNRLRDAIIASQTELGVDPSGTFGTVRARLDALSASVSVLTSGSVSTADLSEIISDLSDLEALTNSHISDTGNPHSVTAAQVGAPTTTDFTNHTTDTSNPHSVTAAQVDAPNRVAITTDEAIVRFDGMSGQMQDSSSGPFVDDNGRLRILESSDPTAAADSGYLYTKDISGTTELFYLDSAGNVTSLTEADGTTVTGSGTDNTLVRWDGTNSIQNSGITVDDLDNLTITQDSAVVWSKAAHSSGAGTLLTIKGQDAFATSAGAGGGVTILAGDADGAGAGGAISIQPGAGGTGGTLTLRDSLGTARVTITSQNIVDLSGNIRIASTSASISGPTLAFLSTTPNPSFYQSDDSTASAIGDTFTIHAQNTTGTTSTGGDLTLNAGSGTFADGQINIGSTNTSVINIGNSTDNPTINFLGTGDTTYNSNLVFAEDVVSPTIYQITEDDITSSQTLLIHAQDNTVSGSVGGDLQLRPGSGVSGHGDIDLQSGDGSARLRINSVGNVSTFASSAVALGVSGATRLNITSSLSSFQTPIEVNTGAGTVSSSGDIRMRNAGVITAKTSGGTDTDLVQLNGSNVFVMGDSGVAAEITSSSTINIRISSVTRAQFNAAGLSILQNDLQFTDASTAPHVYQGTKLASGTGDTFTINAQDSAIAGTTNIGGALTIRSGDATNATTNTGGDITLRSGDGASADGQVLISRGTSTSVLAADSSNNLYLGGTVAAAARPSSVIIDPQSSAFHRIAGTDVFQLFTSSANVNVSTFQFRSTVSAPTILQETDNTNSITGDNFTIHAQDATGLTSTGGTLILRPGSGTSTHGALILRSGDNLDRFVISSTKNVAITPANLLSINTDTVAGAMQVQGDRWTFAAAVINPKITQVSDTTNGITADALTISAQTATGTTSTGGDLTLRAGSGTSADGNVNIGSSNTTSILVGNATDNPFSEFLGSGDVRLSSQIRFTERVGDPTNVANAGFVYTKDDAGTTQLFYEDSAGGVTQITTVGGGSTVTGTGTDNQVVRWNGTSGVQGSGITIDDNGDLLWSSTIVGPIIRQFNTTVGNGETFTIQAQGSSAAGSTGGSLALYAGTGVTTNGDVNIGISNTNQVIINGAAGVSLQRNNTTWWTFNGTAAFLTAARLRFDASIANPEIDQFDTTTGNGQTLSIKGQTSTAATSTGGDLALYAGSGTSLNGDINIGTSNTNIVNVGTPLEVNTGAGTVATTGDIRFPASAFVRAKGSTGDATPWQVSGDTVVIGGLAPLGNTQMRGAVNVATYIGSNQRFSVGDTIVNCGVPLQINTGAGTVATAGDIRTRNAFSLYSKTSGGVDTQLLEFDASNEFMVGDPTNIPTTYVEASSLIRTRIAGTTTVDFNSTAIIPRVNSLRWNNTNTPAISQIDTASGNGASMSITAQNSTDAGSTGGTLFLNAGSGTSVAGNIRIGNVGNIVGVATPLEVNTGAGTVATTGDIRTRNNFTLHTKTVGGVDVRLLAINGVDTVLLGDANNNSVSTSAISSIVSVINGSNQLYIDSSGLRPYGSIRWDSASTTPLISQLNTASGNGATLSIAAQTSTDAGSTGGDLTINAGSGTSLNGDITIGTTNTNIVNVGTPLEVNTNAGTVATSGAIRLTADATSGSIWGGATRLIYADSFNDIEIGSGAAGNRHVKITAGGGDNITLQVDANNSRYTFSPTLATFDHPLAVNAATGTVATAGDIRGRNDFSLYARTTGAANALLLNLDTSNNFIVGDTTNAANTYLRGAGNMFFQVNGNNTRAHIDSDEMRLYVTNFRWTSSAISPTISHVASSTNGTTGQPFGIISQDVNASSGTNAGGSMTVRAGNADTSSTGTNTGGELILKGGNASGGLGSSLTGGNVSISPGSGNTLGTLELQDGNGNMRYRVQSDGDTQINGAASHFIQINGSTVAQFISSALAFSIADVRWNSTVSAPSIFQSDETGGGVSGDTLTIQAQNATGTGIKVGGHLVLRPGNASNGSDFGGSLYLLNGDGATDGNTIMARLVTTVVNAQGMQNGIFIGESTAIPTGNPTGGGFLYVDGGALWWRGPNGTITQIADA